MKTPFFSIIIPMYNRQNVIGRAIKSCLMQSSNNIEIIIVDDGSKDNSAEIVRDFKDKRIRLIHFDENRGVSAARNEGIRLAQGQWVIFLDSDDELLPGALEIIYERAVNASDEVSRIRFMCRTEAGDIACRISVDKGRLDYRDYVRWMDSVYGHVSDLLQVVRRNTFEKVKYPNGRATEGLYHLDFAKNYLAENSSDVVYLIHNDAENRLTDDHKEQLIQAAKDKAASLERVFAEHGNALFLYAPRAYFGSLCGIATQYFLSRQRVRGLKWGMKCIAQKPYSIRAWSILVLGLFHARFLAGAKSSHTAFRAKYKKG